MTGFREETPGMGFGYMDMEIRVVRKGENEATIKGTSYVTDHESEVPPSSTTKTMKRMQFKNLVENFSKKNLSFICSYAII